MSWQLLVANKFFIIKSIGISYGLYHQLKGLITSYLSWYFDKEIHLKHIPKQLLEEIRLIAEIESRYYKLYNENNKKQLLRRTAYFVLIKKFHFRGGLPPSREKKIIICLHIQEMLMGMLFYSLNLFRDFYIYPKSYQSPFTNTENKGETNSKGMIVFSYQDVLLGKENKEDNVHLIYHEIAHAIFIQAATKNPLAALLMIVIMSSYSLQKMTRP